jgi:hypothetical protein
MREKSGMLALAKPWHAKDAIFRRPWLILTRVLPKELSYKSE